MAVTLKDIADRSGVSMKTVSRVLNNEANVSPNTRERVEEAALDLGYRPNLAAKSLASSRAFLVAMLYDDVANSYVLSLMDGATEACRKGGYHLIVEPVHNHELTTEVEVMRLLRRLNVDGLILTPPLSDNATLLSVIDSLGMKAVRLAPFDIEGRHPVITIDNKSAARNITTHLIGKGHRRIGFIKGIMGHSATQARLEGYREALDIAGIAFDSQLVAEGDFTWQAGRHAAGRLMAVTPSPTAIFASNDDMAAGVLSWTGAYGRKVPDEIAIAGFDNTPLSQLVYPPLTTVGQDVSEMGRLAATLLIEEKTHNQMYDFPLELILRASTDDAQ